MSNRERNENQIDFNVNRIITIVMKTEIIENTVNSIFAEKNKKKQKKLTNFEIKYILKHHNR